MTYAPTVHRISQLILLCNAPYDSDLVMFVRNITQAYTQSKKHIFLKMYIYQTTLQLTTWRMCPTTGC